MKINKIDNESGCLNKNMHEISFGYSIHTVCDRNGWIVNYETTGANVHDCDGFYPLYKKIKEANTVVDYVVMDAGYKTLPIYKKLIDNNIIPCVPYSNR